MKEDGSKKRMFNHINRLMRKQEQKDKSIKILNGSGITVNDICENYVGSVYVGGYGGLNKSGLCVFCKLCPVWFLVIGKGLSVLL